MRVSIIGSSAAASVVPGFNDYEFKMFEREFLSNGYVRGLAVSQRGAGANLSVDVAAGLGIVEITNTNLAHGKTYKVYVESSATANVLIAAADPTNPRKDKIILRVSVSEDPDGNAANIGTIEVVQGTPAGSPSTPSTPANAIALAVISVAAGATSVVTANITDSRGAVQMNSTSLLPDLARASETAAIRNGSAFSVVTTGSSNAYAATLSSLPTTLSQWQIVRVEANFTNTGAATFNYNSTGAVAIKKNGSSALSAGDMVSGAIAILEYDGTNWQLLNPASVAALYTDHTVYLGYTDSSSASTSNNEAYFDTHQPTISANDLINGVGYEIDIAGSWTFTSGSVNNIVLNVGGTDLCSITLPTVATGTFAAHFLILGTAAAGGSVAIRAMGRGGVGQVNGNGYGTINAATNGSLTVKFGMNNTGSDSAVLKMVKMTKVSTTAF